MCFGCVCVCEPSRHHTQRDILLAASRLLFSSWMGHGPYKRWYRVMAYDFLFRTIDFRARSHSHSLCRTAHVVTHIACIHAQAHAHSNTHVLHLVHSNAHLVCGAAVQINLWPTNTLILSRSPHSLFFQALPIHFDVCMRSVFVSFSALICCDGILSLALAVCSFTVAAITVDIANTIHYGAHIWFCTFRRLIWQVEVRMYAKKSIIYKWLRVCACVCWSAPLGLF